MTWIAVSPLESQADASARMPALSPAADDVQKRGSLYVEADLGRGAGNALDLLVLDRRADVSSQIALSLSETGGARLTRVLGRRSLQIRLNGDERPLSGVLRLSVSWDAPARWGLLTLERLHDGVLLQKEFDNPLPWLKSDLQRIEHRMRDVAIAPEVHSFAISDCPEPVGVSLCLGADSPVRTPQGYRPVKDLKAGDIVSTDRGPMPVLWTGGRVVPARGRFQPIVLRKPFFGLQEDIVVAPDQRICVSGAEVEYLFGEEAVLVEAGDLLNTPFALRDAPGSTIDYHQVLLPEHAMLDVAGTQLESLFAGELRESPRVLAHTVLNSLSFEQMPLHPRLAYPALRGYEAVTLCAALAGH